MISQLIDEFENLLLELSSSLGRSNDEQSSVLGLKIEQTWQNILIYNPNNKAERAISVSFLLDVIVKHDDSNDLGASIKKKILSLM